MLCSVRVRMAALRWERTSSYFLNEPRSGGICASRGREPAEPVGQKESRGAATPVVTQSLQARRDSRE